MIKYLILISSILFILLCCDKNSSVDSSDDNDVEMVPVSVEFVFGIKEETTYLKFNGKTYYKAILTGLVPFSGPEGSVYTYLPRGKNTIHVAIRNNLNILYDFEEDFIIEDQDVYPMALTIKSVGDSSYLEISNDILR